MSLGGMYGMAGRAGGGGGAAGATPWSLVDYVDFTDQGTHDFTSVATKSMTSENGVAVDWTAEGLSGSLDLSGSGLVASGTTGYLNAPIADYLASITVDEYTQIAICIRQTSIPSGGSGPYFAAGLHAVAQSNGSQLGFSGWNRTGFSDVMGGGFASGAGSLIGFTTITALAGPADVAIIVITPISNLLESLYVESASDAKQSPADGTRICMTTLGGNYGNVDTTRNAAAFDISEDEIQLRWSGAMGGTWSGLAIYTRQSQE